MTWEQRMADKAAARAAEQDRVNHEEWLVEEAKIHEEYVTEVAAELTVDEAQYAKDNPWGGACACIGGRACCRVRLDAIERVLNEAQAQA